MQRFVIFLACCVALSDLAVGLAEDDGPAMDVPELKVLEHYLGTWDVAVTNKDSDFPARATRNPSEAVEPRIKRISTNQN